MKDKINICRENNIEYMTETWSERIGETPWGEAIIEPVEVCVGEFCRKTEIFNPYEGYCNQCEHWKW